MIYGTGYADVLKTSLFEKQNSAIKKSLEKLSSEAVTGLASDPAEKLGGNVTALAQVDSSERVVMAELSNIQFAEARLQVVQDVLSWIQGTNDDVAQKTISEMPLGSRGNVDMRVAEAEEIFKSMVAKLNTQHGPDYVFSGQSLNTPPLKNAVDMVAEIKARTAAMTSAADIEAEVNAWMSDSVSGFLEGVPSGASAQSYTLVDNGRKVAASASVLDPSVVETIRGWALTLSVSGRSDLADTQARAVVSKGANIALNGGEMLRQQQAAFGRDQELAETIGLEKQSEKSSLRKAKLSLLQADQYEASVALNEYRSSMERLYAITARISNVSLVNYLR